MYDTVLAVYEKSYPLYPPHNVIIWALPWQLINCDNSFHLPRSLNNISVMLLLLFLIRWYDHIPVSPRAMRRDDDHGGGESNLGNGRSGITNPRCSGRSTDSGYPLERRRELTAAAAAHLPRQLSGDNQNVSERAKSVGNRQILRFGTPRIGRKGDL